MSTPKRRSPTKSTKRPRYLGTNQDVASAPRRIKAILQALDRTYLNARTALKYRNPFELLIATILSAQSTDETVTRATPPLPPRAVRAHANAGPSRCCRSHGCGNARQAYRLLSSQGAGHHGLRSGIAGALRRRGSAHLGGADCLARRRPQAGQRRPLELLASA